MQVRQITYSLDVEKLPLRAPIGCKRTAKGKRESAGLAVYRAGTGLITVEVSCVVLLPSFITFNERSIRHAGS